MSLIAGKELGPYKILRLLGEGAVGAVYEAIDTRLDRKVALKVLHDKAASKFDSETLKKEAQLAAKVDSPYVVKVYEFETYDNMDVISYELVEGLAPDTALDSCSLQEKVEVLACLAEGLAAAHDKGLVHRDLKPENILVTDNRIPKILDFGIAIQKSPELAFVPGQIAGTIAYMSPEQLQDAELDHRSDLFSFGLVAYKLITGLHPLLGEYEALTIYRIQQEEAQPPTDHDPSIPAHLSELIVNLLKKDREERPSSARDVAKRLRESLIKRKQTVETVTTRPVRKVVVCQLKDLSEDKSWEYFCTGLKEEIIKELSRASNAVITGHSEPAEAMDVAALFKKLRVDYIVIGNLMRLDNIIRLSISMYQHGNMRVVYGSEFQDRKERLFDLMGDAVSELTTALTRLSSGFGVSDVSTSRSVNITAYDYFLRGRHYYSMSTPQDLERASDLYEKALEIDPEFAPAHAGLSDVYTFQYMAWYDHSNERIEAAKESAEEALAIDKSSPDALRALGRYYKETGSFERAKENFELAVSVDRKYSLGYRSLAWLDLELGNLDAALRNAKKALQLAPTDTETHLLMGLLYLDQKQYTSAMATVQRATELSPDFGRCYYILGDTYSKLGVWELALENFEKAATYEGDPNAWADAGYMHLVLGNCDEAIGWFDESADRGYFAFASYYLKGLALLACGEKGLAHAEFQHVLNEVSRDANDPLALSYLAMAHAQLADAEKSNVLVSMVLSTQPTPVEAVYNCARAMAVVGQRNRTEELISRVKTMTGGASNKEIAVDPHFSATGPK